MGTPAIAARVLDRLVTIGDSRFHVAAAVTRPDEPRGRGQKVEASEVAQVAARHGIATLKPLKIRTAEFLAEIKSYQPDLLVVVAYGRILPQEILDSPRLMPINLHASLLPRHRGAAPIEGAILAGDRETGVTIMRITQQMDAGPMILKRAIPIAADDTQGSLKAKLAELGAAAMLEALDLIARGSATETPQDDALATYTAPVKKTDAIIDWNGDAARIERMTRAYDPWPVARTTLAGEELLIYRAAVEPQNSDGDNSDVEAALRESPGTILTVAPSLVVQCGTGRLRLLEVQAPGRKRMSAADFARGRRVRERAKLGT